MNRKKQFIFVNDLSRLNVIFKDLENDNRVIVLHGPCKELSNKLLIIIRKIHLNLIKRISNKIPIPFKGIWQCSLRKIKWLENIDYYVMFDNASLYPIKYKYLINLKNRYNIKYILVMNDHWESLYSSDARKYVSNVEFDYIFTIDNDDAEKHGFIFTYSHFSMLSDSICTSIYTDLYFAGMNKGRINLFHGVYNYLNKNGVSCRYRITRVPKKERKYSGIIYNKWISYREVVEELKKSNCILEILTEGQSGASLRYYEAVCYNKKLLTNNKNVVNLPFYNPEYIHIFEKPEDIDCEWVRERISIDYGYDGRFSPSRIIDKIIELEENKDQ